MDWTELFRLVCLAFANVFVGCEAFQGFEAVTEIMS